MTYKNELNKLQKELLDENEGFLIKLRTGKYDKVQYQKIQEHIDSIATSASKDDRIPDGLIDIIGYINNMYYDIYIHRSSQIDDDVEEALTKMAQLL